MGHISSTLAAGIICLCVAQTAHSAQPLYHDDPDHLWNRLHEAMFVRKGPDGEFYGHDRLEPLLWLESKYLLDGRLNARVVGLLEEFLVKRGETLIAEPIKRAVLQRDLWIVFNWLHDAPRSRGGERLRRALAAVIRRLALPAEDVARLPDNYAAAVASGAYLPQYDPAAPDRPLLPADMFGPKGPWVCCTPAEGIVAPRHLDDSAGHPSTNSVFLVMLRLPGGRDATIDYLARLRGFDKPLVVKTQDPEAARFSAFMPNPELPNVPAGTQVALVRRAMLIAASNEIVASPLTESVQLRVYREVPELTAKLLGDASAASSKGYRQLEAAQRFDEFRLSRAMLFSGKAGGLHALAEDERDFKTGFGSHPYDLFERPLRSDQSFAQSGRRFPVKVACAACHGLPGVYSLNSFFNFRGSNLREGETRPPARLSESSVADVERVTVRWKESRPSWTALRESLVK